MPIRKTEAIVLASRPWSDSGAIVTFYTRDYGRVRGVAKGGKRSRTSFGSSMEMLSRIDLVYHEKEGRELETVSEGSLRDFFPELREDLHCLAAACYMLQLVDEMVRGREESGRVFGHLVTGLELLRAGTAPELVLRFFELNLVGLCGFHPHLQRCVGCSRVEHGAVGFSAQLGGILCGRCSGRDTAVLPLSAGSHRALAHLERVDPGRLGRLKLSRSVMEELRGVLTTYIIHILERRPRALDFLDSVTRT